VWESLFIGGWSNHPELSTLDTPTYLLNKALLRATRAEPEGQWSTEDERVDSRWLREGPCPYQ
jgi:hypothetical protein